MSYRHLWSTALLSVVFAAAVHAQSSADSTGKAGTWALQYAIDENFTLGTFSGSIFSLQRHFTDRDAIRFGLGFATTDSDTENESVWEGGHDSASSEDDEVSFDATILYVRALSSRGSVHAYAGVGPLISYESSESSQTTDRTEPDTAYTSTSTSSRTSWNTGAEMVIGAEWNVHESISLHTESGLRVTYRWIDEESTDGRWDRVSSDSREQFSISPTYVRFGVSVWF